MRLLPFLGPLVALVLLLNFGPCLFNLIVKFIFSRLQQFYRKMMAVQDLQLLPVTETTLCSLPLGPLIQASGDFFFTVVVVAIELYIFFFYYSNR